MEPEQREMKMKYLFGLVVLLLVCGGAMAEDSDGFNGVIRIENHTSHTIVRAFFGRPGESNYDQENMIGDWEIGPGGYLYTLPKNRGQDCELLFLAELDNGDRITSPEPVDLCEDNTWVVETDRPRLPRVTHTVWNVSRWFVNGIYLGRVPDGTDPIKNPLEPNRISEPLGAQETTTIVGPFEGCREYNFVIDAEEEGKGFESRQYFNVRTDVCGRDGDGLAITDNMFE